MSGSEVNSRIRVSTSSRIALLFTSGPANSASESLLGRKAEQLQTPAMLNTAVATTTARRSTDRKMNPRRAGVGFVLVGSVSLSPPIGQWSHNTADLHSGSPCFFQD